MDDRTFCASCFSERAPDVACERCGWSEHGEKPLVEGQLPIGSTLRDRYLIGRPLGRGGFSITYLAWDSMLERRRAIKEYFPSGVVTRDGSHGPIAVLSGQTERYADGIQKYLSEARLLARFEGHPCIVYPLDFFEANQTAYLVMEYLEGETLQSYVMRQGGRIPYVHALYFLGPVIRALAAVHRAGILHRDVSPDNVFLTVHGESKLLDFGAARQRRTSRSAAMTVILRENYAPPEQYTTSEPQGYWTDVYAFAATFYFAVCGESPPSALERVLHDRLERPSENGVSIPAEAEDILLRSLAVQPRDRPQWIEDLLPALTGRSESEDTDAAEAEPEPPSPEVPGLAVGGGDADDGIDPGAGGAIAAAADALRAAWSAVASRVRARGAVDGEAAGSRARSVSAAVLAIAGVLAAVWGYQHGLDSRPPQPKPQVAADRPTAEPEPPTGAESAAPTHEASPSSAEGSTDIVDPAKSMDPARSTAELAASPFGSEVTPQPANPEPGALHSEPPNAEEPAPEPGPIAPQRSPERLAGAAVQPPRAKPAGLSADPPASAAAPAVVPPTAPADPGEAAELRVQYEQAQRLLASSKPEERRKGTALLESTARGGLLAAEERLGQLLAAGLSGAVEADDAQALLWYRKAAASGARSARFALARRLELGRWTEEEAPPVAAERGVRCKYLGVACPIPEAPKPRPPVPDPEVAFEAWLLSQSPGRGSAADLQEAFALYRELAKQKLPEAEERLGYMLIAGHGVRINRFDGFQWLRLAATGDRSSAQYATGKMYLTNFAYTLSTNQKAGQCWLRKAAARSEKARQALRKLGIPAPGENLENPPKTCDFPPANELSE